MMMIDYSSKDFWRFFWIFSSSDQVLFTHFFLWHFWRFSLQKFSSQPSIFVDISPNPIKLGLENTVLISSRLRFSDLWLDHVVGPTTLVCSGYQGRLAYFGAIFCCVFSPLLLFFLVQSYQFICSSVIVWCYTSWILWFFLHSLVTVPLSSSCFLLLVVSDCYISLHF